MVENGLAMKHSRFCRPLLLLAVSMPIAAVGQTAPAQPDPGSSKQTPANVIDCGTFAASDARLDLVSKLCEFVLTYRDKLPDFIAQQTTTSYGSGSVDVITAQVTFRKGQEEYSNVRINGKPVEAKGWIPAHIGFTTSGEFGSLLVNLFQVPGAAEFRFQKTATLGGADVAIYEFRLPKKKNTFWGIGYVRGNTLFPEFHGRVWLERQTGRPLREELSPTNLEPSGGIASAKLVTEYAITTIGNAGKFLLPVRSESTACSGGLELNNSRCATNVLVFHDYRKFAATSRILSSGSQP